MPTDTNKNAEDFEALMTMVFSVALVIGGYSGSSINHWDRARTLAKDAPKELKQRVMKSLKEKR